MQILTLTEDSRFGIQMNICPMCWSTHEAGDRVVWPGKGTEAICLDCASAIVAVLHHRTCERCQKSFTGRATSRYCSNACRQAAYRARLPAARSPLSVGPELVIAIGE